MKLFEYHIRTLFVFELLSTWFERTLKDESCLKIFKIVLFYSPLPIIYGRSKLSIDELQVPWKKSLRYKFVWNCYKRRVTLLYKNIIVNRIKIYFDHDYGKLIRRNNLNNGVILNEHYI